MQRTNFANTTRKFSKNFYYSSLFFPKNIREDVFVLYSFVRKADNFTDSISPQSEKLENYKKQTFNILKDYRKKPGDEAIEAFVKLSKKYSFSEEWIEAFFNALEIDMKRSYYQEIEDLNEFIYGVAEVIGLMMAKILNLPDKSLPYARMLGRSMQYANIIRDVKEDISLGRCYFPQSDLKNFSIINFTLDYLKDNPEKFSKLILFEIDRYENWQQEAEKGFRFIPKRYLVPIKTSSDNYKWTISLLKKNPKIILEKKLKPTKTRVILNAFKNLLLA